MPPEVKALQSENVITCVDGAIRVSSPNFFTPQLNTWVADFTAACPGTTVEVVPAGDPNVTAVFDIAGQVQVCKPEIQSPVAFDAAVPVATFADGSTLNLSPKTLSNVLDGKITSWSDPTIASENEGVSIPNLPIAISSSFFKPATSAFDAWMSRIDSANWKLNPALNLVDDFDPNAPDPSLATDGNVSIVPFSLATSIGITPIGIITDPNSDPLVAEVGSIYAGGTQIEVAVTNSKLSEAKLNPDAPAQSQPGSDHVSQPWQGMYTIQASSCAGPAEQASRAFIRFVLRSDEQASLSGLNYLPLMDQIRFEAIGALQAGLPEPSLPPSDAPTEVVPTDMPTDLPSVAPTDVPTPVPTS